MTDERRGLRLGGIRPVDGTGETRTYELPSDDLVTHGVILGGTGSGKTGAYRHHWRHADRRVPFA